jgi:hypothetical protein
MKSRASSPAVGLSDDHAKNMTAAIVLAQDRHRVSHYIKRNAIAPARACATQKSRLPDSRIKEE